MPENIPNPISKTLDESVHIMSKLLQTLYKKDN
jgi:hypothetical protein